MFLKVQWGQSNERERERERERNRDKPRQIFIPYAVATSFGREFEYNMGFTRASNKNVNFARSRVFKVYEAPKTPNQTSDLHREKQTIPWGKIHLNTH